MSIPDRNKKQVVKGDHGRRFVAGDGDPSPRPAVGADKPSTSDGESESGQMDFSPERALELLRAWRETDTSEHYETWVFLKKTLDTCRSSNRKLFP